MKELRVLMLNGSPRANGNTSIALREMEKIFTESGVAVETVQVGNQAVCGCVACNGCAKLGKCVFDDVVNELAPKFEQAARPRRGKPRLLCVCQCDACRLP